MKLSCLLLCFALFGKGVFEGSTTAGYFSGGREFGGGGEPEVTTQESTIQPGRTTTLTFNHPDNRKRLMKPVVNATDKIWLRGEYDFPWIHVCRKTMLACRYTGSRRVGLIAARLSVMLKW